MTKSSSNNSNTESNKTAPEDVATPESDDKSPEEKLDELAKALESEQLHTASNKTPNQETRTRKSQRRITKPSKTEPKLNSEPASKARVWPFVVLNLLLIGVMIGFGYLAWQQSTELESRLAQQQDEKQETLVSDLNNRFLRQQQQLELQIQQLQSTIDSQQEALTSQQEQIASIAGSQDDNWTVAEVSFLVRMAGRKLWLEKDTKTALKMLESADGVLAESQNPAYIPLRAAIAEDRGNISNVNIVPKQEIALRLNALTRKVALLAFPEPETFYREPEEEVSSDISEWDKNLGILWRSIRENFIDIETMDAPLAPYLSKQQQFLNKSELKLQLLIAQEALLVGQDKLYVEALQSTNVLVQSYDTTKANVLSFQQEVNALLEFDLSPELPQELAAFVVLKSLEQASAPSIQESATATEEQSL